MGFEMALETVKLYSYSLHFILIVYAKNIAIDTTVSKNNFSKSINVKSLADLFELDLSSSFSFMLAINLYGPNLRWNKIAINHLPK